MTPQFQPIATKRLYRHIADVLLESIASGNFAAGSFLPPERDLAKQFGVSRASVREALIALEVQGRVSVRVGAGVQVLDVALRAQPQPSDAEPVIGPLDVLDARFVVEAETAALAARHATAHDLQTLQAALAQMLSDHARAPLQHEGDRNFHIGIARASGNAALLMMVTTLWEQRYTPLQERLESLFNTPGLLTNSAADHGAILDAIRSHDPARARQAMRRHLNSVRKTFLRAIDGKA